MLTNTYIKVQNWTKGKVSEEKGEMASWMILGAGLAGIALGLKEPIGEIMEDLAGKVGGGE